MDNVRDNVQALAVGRHICFFVVLFVFVSFLLSFFFFLFVFSLKSTCIIWDGTIAVMLVQVDLFLLGVLGRIADRSSL